MALGDWTHEFDVISIYIFLKQEIIKPQIFVSF